MYVFLLNNDIPKYICKKNLMSFSNISLQLTIYSVDLQYVFGWLVCAHI